MVHKQFVCIYRLAVHTVSTYRAFFVSKDIISFSLALVQKLLVFPQKMSLKGILREGKVFHSTPFLRESASPVRGGKAKA